MMNTERTEASEYKAGQANGAKHVDMCGAMDNRRKAEEGMKSPHPLIRAYWSGYASTMPPAQAHGLTVTK